MVGSVTFSIRTAMLALVALLLLVVAIPVAAAEIRVDGECSLREAIASANRDSGRGGCEAGDGDDIIVMTRDSKPGQGQLSRIRSTIIIEGENHKLELDNDHAAFKIQGGELTVRNLNIIYYDNTRTRKSFEVYDGKLTLEKVTVENCEVGVLQDSDSHTIIRSNSDICGLPHDKLVIGGQSFEISLPVPLPRQTCSASGGVSVAATYGLASGVQCNQVGADGIGIQSVIDAGFIDAVDVWGYVEQGVEICFAQLGSLTFLDAATSPRTITTINSYSKNGGTCAMLSRPGTLVLVPGAPTGVGPAPTTTTTTVATTTTTGPAITGCGVVALGHLKFLDAPKSDAEIIGYITRGTSMAFVSRVLGWYQVSHTGLTGWVGGKYSARNEAC